MEKKHLLIALDLKYEGEWTMPLQETMHFPKSMTLTITDEMVSRYAAVSKDQTPIHLSDTAAKEAGFPRKVTHGMFTMALSTKLISPILGNTWMIHQLDAKFSAPLFVNDPIIIILELKSEKKHACYLQVTGKNKEGQAVIRGKMMLKRRS